MSRRKDPGTLPPTSDLLALSSAAVLNSSALLTDAERLADAGSYPRAHALATLAEEELGKACLCFLAGMMRGSMMPKIFWQRFYSHEGKLAAVRGLSGLLEEVPIDALALYAKRILATSATSHDQKMHGLYVDYEDGIVRQPSDIGEQEARELITAVRNRIPSRNLSDSVVARLFNVAKALMGDDLDLAELVAENADVAAAMVKDAVDYSGVRTLVLGYGSQC